MRKGIRLDNRNNVNELKTGTQNVLKSRLGNESKVKNRISTTEHNLANRIKSAQSGFPKSIQSEKFIVKDENDKLISTVTGKEGKCIDNYSNSNRVKSVLGEPVKDLSKDSMKGVKVVNKVVKTGEGESEKSKFTKLKFSKNLKDTKGLVSSIKNLKGHLLNKTSQNKSCSVNKVQSTVKNYYNDKYFEGDIGSTEDNQKFFIHKKHFYSGDEISTVGTHKNISRTTRFIPFSELQQVELNDSISHEAITGTGFLPAMVVQKITQIIFQSHEKQISEMSFIIDGKQLGSLEIKFTQDSIGNQATIIVESETIRNLIEKVLPIINENLSQKGMALNSLEVQVGDFGKSKMQDEKHKRYSEKYRASNIKDEIEDKINQIIAIRDYGYNTIEVLA